MALPTLPDDIIREVFGRTSLETLGRITLLSKEWNRMTYDSAFKQQFRERRKTISGFSIQKIMSWSEDRISFVSIDDDDEKSRGESKSFT